MPIPEKNPNEDKQKFVSRCMSNPTMTKEYPDPKQRAAVCLSQTRKVKGSLIDSVMQILAFSLFCDSCEDNSTEELTLDNLVVPHDSQYISFGETEEEYDISHLTKSKYEYMDPITFEIYYFNQPGNYKKNNRYLKRISKTSASEYQGRKVTLNKPFRTPDGPKKSSVYVKNEKGNVVKVNFGDPNMKIKKNIPGRRKSFRARHNCDNPGPKWKARYWSCKAW